MVYLVAAVIAGVCIFWLKMHRIRTELAAIDRLQFAAAEVLRTRRGRIQQLLDLLTPVWKFNPDLVSTCRQALAHAIAQSDRGWESAVRTENTLAYQVSALLRATIEDISTVLQVTIEDESDPWLSPEMRSVLEKIRRFDDDELERLNLEYDCLARDFNDRFNRGFDRAVLWTMRLKRRPCPLVRRITPKKSSVAAQPAGK